MSARRKWPIVVIALVVLAGAIMLVMKHGEAPSNSQLLGYWHAAYEVSRNGKDDVTQDAAKDMYLCLWPNGDCTLDLGLGMGQGEWKQRGLVVALTIDTCAYKKPQNASYIEKAKTTVEFTQKGATW